MRHVKGEWLVNSNGEYVEQVHQLSSGSAQVIQCVHRARRCSHGVWSHELQVRRMRTSAAVVRAFGQWHGNRRTAQALHVWKGQGR